MYKIRHKETGLFFAKIEGAGEGNGLIRHLDENGIVWEDNPIHLIDHPRDNYRIEYELNGDTHYFAFYPDDFEVICLTEEKRYVIILNKGIPSLEGPFKDDDNFCGAAAEIWHKSDPVETFLYALTVKNNIPEISEFNEL